MLTLLFVVLSGLAPARALSQSGPDSAVYLVARGRYTTQVEWAIQEGSRVRVLVVTRATDPVVRRYDITLGSDGAIERMEVFDASGAGTHATLTPRARIYQKGDSTIEERAQGVPLRLATAGRTHLYNSGGTGTFLFSMMALQAGRAPAAVGDSLVGQHVAGTLGARPLVIRRLAQNEASIGSARTGVMRVRFAADRRPVRIDAMGSSFNVIADRTSWLDHDSVVKMLAQMERRQPQGPTSPRDSSVAAVNGARIVVDYGRPSKRGRQVFGGIVPWHRIWRTGANLATHLITDRPLAFGNATLPAGRYTLWTLPTPEGWTLIINRQTDQWGTDYEPTHDAMRLPMEVRARTEPTEQFTIAVEPQPSGGALRLTWDLTEASVLFRIR